MFCFGFDFISTKKQKTKPKPCIKNQNGELNHQNLVLTNQNPVLVKSLSFDLNSSLFYISHAAGIFEWLGSWIDWDLGLTGNLGWQGSQAAQAQLQSNHVLIVFVNFHRIRKGAQTMK